MIFLLCLLWISLFEFLFLFIFFSFFNVKIWELKKYKRKKEKKFKIFGYIVIYFLYQKELGHIWEILQES